MTQPFYLRQDNVFALPVIHYCMEAAAMVNIAYRHIKPECVCVELPETMSGEFKVAASRLPDISVCAAFDGEEDPIYFPAEPCDPAFEALRLGLEEGSDIFCVDLDVGNYPDIRQNLPDPYIISRIGMKAYFNIFKKIKNPKGPEDKKRELYMGKRLKELSFSYDRILFVGGMSHVEAVLKHMKEDSYPPLRHLSRAHKRIFTLTEKSCRECMAEFGWLSIHYEKARHTMKTVPDRHKIIYRLYRAAAEEYGDFPGYNYRNIMKFLRNLAVYNGRLMPDLYQILVAAKGSVDHNFAYETWAKATDYPFLKNIDGLPELELSAKDLWGHSKLIRFQIKESSKKALSFRRKIKKSGPWFFEPHPFFGICSYPREDVAVEKLGDFLRKKGALMASEEESESHPFLTGLEDGLDIRETIRHMAEKKLYVFEKKRLYAPSGSVVVIFDEDEGKKEEEKYPWRVTWLGEHDQESDMAFYATRMDADIVGPGISRCEYGGFMLSYPPRRMYNVWDDPDYGGCGKKSEILLQAAIDYSVKPVITFVAGKPPRAFFKNYAARFGKKVVYIPIGQLSPIILKKIRVFHVLDGHDKRKIADEYIN